MTQRSGQIAIVTIALVGLSFFGGMELLKKQMHSPPSALSSVVVLPAKVVGPVGSAGMDYLTDAVPGSISALLVQVHGLDTKTPPSSIEVEQLQGDLKRIAETYRVTAVITSEITVEEDALTLNIQLVNPETRSLLWNSQYKSNDYNSLMRQAADGAGHALQPASTRVTSTEGLGATSAAELAYREGEYYLRRSDCDHSSVAFKRALRLDPGLAATVAVAHQPPQGSCSMPWQ
jgi:TolB-like protein